MCATWQNNIETENIAWEPSLTVMGNTMQWDSPGFSPKFLTINASLTIQDLKLHRDTCHMTA